MPLVCTVQRTCASWRCAVCHEHQPTDSAQYLRPELAVDLAQRWDASQQLCKRCWATALRFSYPPN
jgi:hypothetical protein